MHMSMLKPLKSTDVEPAGDETAFSHDVWLRCITLGYDLPAPKCKLSNKLMRLTIGPWSGEVQTIGLEPDNNLAPTCGLSPLHDGVETYGP